MKPRIQISIPREEAVDQKASHFIPRKETTILMDHRNFPINNECTSLGIYQDAFVLAGFCDGTVRIFDIQDAFVKPNHAVEEELQPPYVNSNIYQSYGAVACQIHAKGVHTNLRTELKVAGDYCFASVVRGSMECVAIRLDGLMAKPTESNILDAIIVTRHSDAKLRGLTHATRLANGEFLLLAGKAIKNLHIWRFAAPDQWECLYDKPTNGNTIQWSTTIGTSVVSKSEGQCIRVWNIPSLYDGSSDTVSYYDMVGTESALAVANDWKLYSTGVFCPGHLKVQSYETDELSHLSIVPQAGASRRHYASVERVVVTDGGIVMALVSDGSVWCGVSSLEKIASDATAGQVSQHYVVVATNSAIECRILPWKKKLKETPAVLPDPVADDGQRNDIEPGNDTPQHPSNETHPKDSKTMIPDEAQHSRDETIFDMEQSASIENDKKRANQATKSIQKSKKKPRIQLKNILHANPPMKTPTHRSIAPVVTETKMTDETVPSMIVPDIPQPIATPCIKTPIQSASPVIPRKTNHSCTPRKLECNTTTNANEACESRAVEVHASDTDAAMPPMETDNSDERPSLSDSDRQTQSSTESLETKPPRRKVFQMTVADRKQQLRRRMCRRQMQLIDKDIRQLPRTEESFVKSRVWLLARTAIQDVVSDNTTVGFQRAKLEHETLPAFRKHILIPWQFRCELESIKPTFDDISVFDQALGYLEAIDLV